MNIKKSSIISFLFVSILGTLLHFTYDWSGQNPIVGIFSAQNESTWEHLKLLFFPMLFLTIIQCLISSKLSPDFIQNRTIGIVSGMLFITVVFYTTWGITGKLVDWWNITLYFFGVLFAFWIEANEADKNEKMAKCTAIAILIVITLAFIIFSFHPADTGIFYDLSKHPKG